MTRDEFQKMMRADFDVIQAGIGRIVAPSPTAEQRERWGESFAYAAVMLGEADVTLDLIGAA